MMNKNIKNILIASNPFGFGPTGQAIPLLRELVDSIDKEIKVFFIGSSLCLEIIKNEFGEEVNIVELDERNEIEIENFANTLVGGILFIGVQNRFMPVVAKKFNMESIFVDLLGWFWEVTPESHLVANKIYWTNFFNIVNGKKTISERVKVVGLMHNYLPANANKINPFILVSIGGAKNPLINDLQENYLKLTCMVFSKLSEMLNLKILIVSSFDAVDYLKKEYTNLNLNTNLEFKTFTHKEMISKMSEAKFHFTIGGQGATMESYLAGIPTGFYLPSNLSQEDFQKEIKLVLPEIKTCIWEDLLGEDNLFLDLKEKDAIVLIDNLCEKMLKDEKLISKCLVYVNNILLNPKTEAINTLISKMGNDGAKTIVDDIIELIK